jgi:hypothetical protein
MEEMKVKKTLLVVLGIIFTMGLIAAISFASSDGKMELKAGDQVYACNCGEKCACGTLSMNPGNCTCGKPMVKTTVTKVENGDISVEGQTKTYKSVGKYACACGPACKCGTISQNPGNCTCGTKMKEVK